MIDQNTIMNIVETADIVEVVGEFVRLKKRGVNFTGLCPFHNEKTPSFSVSPARGIYKCFGCGKGGNVVNFIMDHENLSYPEALKYLARKYHIEIDDKEPTPEEIEQKNERESLMVVTEFAQKYFTKLLHEHAQGKAIGLSYLRERGFRDDIIEKFQLGYCLDSWDAFTGYAKSQGYKTKYLVGSGLTIEKNNKYFDRFSGRIMFPIHAVSGKIIGFGGRTLKADKKTAKYLNSPESEIYHKSQVLYGLYFAKRSIMKEEKCYLVEGYTDVIAFHQSGIENVLASSGTSLTEGQIRLIKRFTENVTVIYDGDEAGIKASLRGIDLILKEGLNIKVLALPEEEDPDSFAKKHDMDSLKAYIAENEADFIHFKTKLLLEDAKKDPIRRANLVSDIVRSIAVIPNTITRSVYIKECSSLLNMDEKVLYYESNKIRRQQFEKERKWQKNAAASEKNEAAKNQQNAFEIREGYDQEKELIRALLTYGHKSVSTQNEDTGEEYEITVADYIKDEIHGDELDFGYEIFKKIFHAYFEVVSQNGSFDEKMLINHSDEQIVKFIIDIMSPKYHQSRYWKRGGNFYETEEDRFKQVVKDTLLAFKQVKIQHMLQDTEKRLGKAQESEQEEEVKQYFHQFNALTHLKMELAKNLGFRTILK